jgi:hypothetical protein
MQFRRPHFLIPLASSINTAPRWPPQSCKSLSFAAPRPTEEVLAHNPLKTDFALSTWPPVS